MQTADGSRRTPRVLIVEDESRLRSLLLEEIPDMGFPATGARSAEEAKRVMESDPHEIMLLDLRLPIMGGMEFFESVRASWPRTQVVVLTGYGDLESARMAIRLNVVDFLSKPCRLRELEVALDRARQRISPAGEAIKSAGPLANAATEDQSSLATLAQREREQIAAALEKTGGNRTAAARALGISRRTLHYRLREYRKQGYRLD
jgi:DNA-binding NtrC family response regulator